MADVRHRNITEGEKHEPKNFSTAPVYAQLIKDENSTSRYLKIQLLEPALNFVDGFVAPPVSPIIGDTYLVLDEGNGVIDTGWDSCIYNDLARFNGVEWIGITPTNGNIIYDLTGKKFHEFKDGVWSVFIPFVPTLYSANGTILTGREATITDTLTFLGGRVGIGQTPNASAILDLSVNNKGIKFPEVNNAEMIAISSPADNLLVLNTQLHSLYRYDLPTTSWVSLSAGYGIISVNDSSGVPTYYADLQTACEVCKASGGVFTIEVHSNIILTSTINIKSNGSGIGNAYLFKSLTINLNGYNITNNQADTSGCFDVFLRGSTGDVMNFSIINGGVLRTSGTGTHYAITSDYAGHYGNLLFSKVFFYCQNSIAGNFEIENPNINDLNFNDFGGSVFYSDGATALNIRDIYCENFSAISNSSANAIVTDTGVKIKNFSVKNISTGIALNLRRTAQAYFFTATATTNNAIYLPDDYEGVCSHFYAETTTGDTLYALNGGTQYEREFSNFELRATTGSCIRHLGTGGVFSNFYAINNGTSQTIEIADAIDMSNGQVTNRGSGLALTVVGVSTLVHNISFCKFTSYGDACANVSNTFIGQDISFDFCTFESKFDDVNGNAVEILTDTGVTDFSNCKFKVTNATSNGIYSSSAKTIALTNSTFKGATTSINANVTITASTDLSNGNRKI